MQKKHQALSLGAIAQLTRFWNLVIIGIAQYFTAFFLVGTHTLSDPALLLLSFSTILIAAAGYIINDYYDVKIDLINKPERVVIGKTIARRYAILLHSVLSFAGVALGLLLSWQVAAINFFASFLLWFYSNHLKRLPFVGNFVVALLTGLSVALINLLYHQSATLIYIYAVFAFMITLVREIIKDMEDLKGDNTYGCKTLPIVWGIPKTRQFIYAILFLFIAGVLVIHVEFVDLPVAYFTLFLFVPLFVLMLRLARADTKKDFYHLSTLSKVIMLLGILSMSVVK